MKRKSLLFGLLAVLSAVLIFTGCANPADGAAGPQGLGGGQGPEGPKGVATLPSGATPALLAAYFKNADKVFMVSAPVAGNFTVPQGKTLAVVDDVDLTGVTLTINAFEGTIDVSGGKFINATSATFLLKPDVAEAFAEAVPSGIVPEYLSSIPDPVAAITGPVVLDSLAIGGSGNITLANYGTFSSTEFVYVIGDLTIDTGATAFDLSSKNLVVYGGIKAKGGIGILTLGSTVIADKLTATGNLKLEGVSNLSELDTGTYTVTVPTEATIELDTLNSTSGGKLELLAAVTKVVIGEGNGNIEFNTGAPAFATAASSFGNTGTTTFKDAAGAVIAVTFNGPVALEDDLTLTSPGTLVLKTGVLLKGAGKVIANDTEIVGAAGGWQVVGAGTVTIGEDTITASAATAVLTAKHADSSITVTGGGKLTVIGQIDVSSFGKVSLVGDNSSEKGKLLLKGGAAIPGNLKTGAGVTNVGIGSTTSNANFLLYPAVGSGATDGIVTQANGSTAIATNTGIVVQGAGANATGGVVLGNIGGGDTANTKDVLITGEAYATTSPSVITSGWKVQVPNS
jgi:hypothetical protein